MVELILNQKTGALQDQLVHSDKPPIAIALNTMVERVCALTGAEGGVIAMRDLQGICCVASTGNAPAVGSRLQLDSGFTRECFETASIMLCNDALADPRIQPSIARALDLRSVLAVPIQGQGSVVGLLEIFSSRLYAFDATHVATLQQVGDLLAPISLRTSIQNQQPVLGDILFVLNGDPPSSCDNHPGNQHPLTLALLDCLAESPRSKINRIRRSDFHDAIFTFPGRLVAKASAIRASLAGCAASLAFGTAGTSGTRKSKYTKNWVMIVSGTALLAGIVTGVLLRDHKSNRGAIVTPLTMTRGASTRTPEVRAAEEMSAIQPIFKSASAPRISYNENSALASATAREQPTVSREPVTTNTSIQRVPSAFGGLDDHPVSKPPIREMTADIPTGSDVAVLPPTESTGFFGTSATPTLPAPLENSSRPAVGGGQLKEPELLSSISPDYPMSARRSRTEGAVVVRIVIDESGNVSDAQAVSGPPLLVQAALTAVRRWKYAPSQLDGKPTTVQIRVTIRFEL